MQKIIPIYIAQNGDNIVNGILGISTNRIHNDIKVRYVDGRLLTMIEYYLDPNKNATDTLLTPEEPTAIYSQLDNPFDTLRVILPLVGGGDAVSSATPIYSLLTCYNGQA